MDGRLRVLGIGADGEALYRQILRMPGESLAAHISRLGCTDAEARQALDELRHQRLVRVSDDGALSADHPRAALERVVSIEEAQLATRRQNLAQLRDAIDLFAADYAVGQKNSPQSPPARERVERAAMASVAEQLAASTDGPVRAAVRSVPDPPPSDFPSWLAQEQAGRGARALYVADIVPAATEWMREWAAAGEEQRIVQQLPSAFVCFGTDVALASATWGDDAGDLVVLRDPVVVAALVELFDRVWVTAAPAEPTDAQDQLIDLMRQGLKDEAIARVLGISLRTVRRRIAELMRAYEVQTRFQLALELRDREAPSS